MKSDTVVIAGATRTPIGDFQGMLSSLSATELGAATMRASVERTHIAAGKIEQVFIGCVLPAGLGQSPARQSALGAGLPLTVQATTVNKMCGSGMQAAIFAYDTVRSGSADIVFAGGMESMTRVPYLMAKHRGGARIGHDVLLDGLYRDGLEDTYESGMLMGHFAEDTAKSYQFSREEQDAYAIASLTRAKHAADAGWFEPEIAAITTAQHGSEKRVARDEHFDKVDVAKIPSLRPAFAPDGTITPASSSAISDGAAGFLVCRQSAAEREDLVIQAEIVGHAAYAGAAREFSTAPGHAVSRLLDRIGWRIADVDLFEVNEAFAVVPMITMRDLGIAHDRMNVWGGACALGHPVGASGARIMVTLLSALQRQGARRGVASLCLAGGEAVAIALEIQRSNRM
jgi:acetyl-CoA C-acetyltransferase